MSREGVRLVQVFDGSLRVSCGTLANQEDPDAKQWGHLPNLVTVVSIGTCTTWIGSSQDRQSRRFTSSSLSSLQCIRHSIELICLCGGVYFSDSTLWRIRPTVEK